MSKQDDLDSFQDIDKLNQNSLNQYADQTLKIQPNICKLTILDDIDELSQKVLGFNDQNQSNFAIEDYSNYKFPQFESQKKQIKTKTEQTGQKPFTLQARKQNIEGRINSPKQIGFRSSEQKKQNFQKNLNINTQKVLYTSLNKDTKIQINLPLDKMLRKQNKSNKNFQMSKQYYGELKDIYGNSFVQSKIRSQGKNFIQPKCKQKNILIPSSHLNTKNSPMSYYAKPKQNLMKISNHSQQKQQYKDTQYYKKKQTNCKKQKKQGINSNSNIGCTIIIKKQMVDLTKNMHQLERILYEENKQRSSHQKQKQSLKGLFQLALAQQKNNQYLHQQNKTLNSTHKQTKSLAGNGFHISPQSTNQHNASIHNTHKNAINFSKFPYPRS